MIPSFDHDILTIKEVAAYSRCSERTVRNRIRAGKLGAKRFGHNLFVPKSALQKYIKERDVGVCESDYHL